jgi:hypothetical protein
MGNSPKLPNSAARRAYLEALQLEWPEALIALHRDVYSRVVPLWSERLAELTGLASGTYEQFSRAMSDQQVDRALKSWATLFSIKDQWMLDAARVTMYTYGITRKDPEEEWPGWILAPPTNLARFAPFEPVISATWVPLEYGGVESWDTFSNRLRSDFNEALNKYRKLQSVHWGALKENTARDARWTVRYQKRTFAVEIADELPGAYADPEQTVWKAIDRFAKEIGLTLHNRRSRKKK